MHHPIRGSLVRLPTLACACLSSVAAGATETIAIVGALEPGQYVSAPTMSGDGTSVFFNFGDAAPGAIYPLVWRLGSAIGPLDAPAGLDRPAILSMDSAGSVRVGVAINPGAPQDLANTHGVAWSFDGTPLAIAMPNLRPKLARDGTTIFATGAAVDDITVIDVATDARGTIAKPSDTVFGSLSAVNGSGSVLVGDFNTGAASGPSWFPYRRTEKSGWQRLDVPISMHWASVDAVSADGQISAGVVRRNAATGPAFAIFRWNGTAVETMTPWNALFTTPSISAHDARMRAVVILSSWSDSPSDTQVLTRTNALYGSADYLASHGMMGLMPSAMLLIHALSDDATTALVETRDGPTPELFLVRDLAPPECGAGDCRAAHDGPGCADANCCARICAIDPFCCDDTWDGICASEAAALCFKQADFNEDGRVDAADLAILLAN